MARGGLPRTDMLGFHAADRSLESLCSWGSGVGYRFGMETPKYKGMLMWYAAFSDHCSLFPTASVIKTFKEELKDYRVSKGTIHFGVSDSGKDKDKPLPAALLKKMVKARLAEMAGKKTGGQKRRG